VLSGKLREVRQSNQQKEEDERMLGAIEPVEISFVVAKRLAKSGTGNIRKSKAEAENCKH